MKQLAESKDPVISQRFQTGSTFLYKSKMVDELIFALVLTCLRQHFGLPVPNPGQHVFTQPLAWLRWGEWSRDGLGFFFIRGERGKRGAYRRPAGWGGEVQRFTFFTFKSISINKI